jgi:oxygen-independent coproporphyrinogen-3 oxidase
MTGQHRYANITNIEAYQQALSDGKLPVASVVPMSRMTRFKDALIMGLRLVEGVDLRSLGERYRIDCSTFLQDTVADLEQADLLCRNADNLRLTPRGRLLSNVVFSRWV